MKNIQNFNEFVNEGNFLKKAKKSWKQACEDCPEKGNLKPHNGKPKPNVAPGPQKPPKVNENSFDVIYSMYNILDQDISFEEATDQIRELKNQNPEIVKTKEYMDVLKRWNNKYPDEISNERKKRRELYKNNK